MEEKIICIRCPRGCELTTTLDQNGALTEVKGNFCRLGKEYAEAEAVSPMRPLTGTIRITGSAHPLIPFYTDQPIPRSQLIPLSGYLHTLTVQAPVHYQDVLVDRPLGLDTTIRASADAVKIL